MTNNIAVQVLSNVFSTVMKNVPLEDLNSLSKTCRELSVAFNENLVTIIRKQTTFRQMTAFVVSVQQENWLVATVIKLSLQLKPETSLDLLDLLLLTERSERRGRQLMGVYNLFGAEIASSLLGHATHSNWAANWDVVLHVLQHLKEMGQLRNLLVCDNIISRAIVEFRIDVLILAVEARRELFLYSDVVDRMSTFPDEDVRNMLAFLLDNGLHIMQALKQCIMKNKIFLIEILLERIESNEERVIGYSSFDPVRDRIQKRDVFIFLLENVDVDYVKRIFRLCSAPLKGEIIHLSLGIEKCRDEILDFLLDQAEMTSFLADGSYVRKLVSCGKIVIARKWLRKDPNCFDRYVDDYTFSAACELVKHCRPKPENPEKC